MQNIVSKILIVVVLLALCGWGLLAKGIRLGSDLQGGVSLIYRVNVPEDADADQVIPQTMEVLKDRVNPTGVLDITFRQLGNDRIEVVMPLPGKEVRDLSDAYQQALQDLLAAAQIIQADLEAHLEAGDAVSQFCGDQLAGARFEQLTRLQEAYDARRAAEQALQASPDDSRAQLAAADADIAYERQLTRVLDMSLDRSQVIRTLNLSTKRAEERDEEGKVILDPATDEPLMRKSDREIALDAIRDQFPGVSSQLDTLVTAYDTYQQRRTGLDDPEDLIRLLRGAGVLEFHIAVPPTGGAVNVVDLRSQLREVGPDNVDRSRGAWYPINELKQWYDGADQLASLEADPASFFAGRNLVVELYEGEHYMLLYTMALKQLTHQDGNWTIERTFRSQDSLGRPAVAFQLDSAGGQRMAKLTGAHVGQPMAIVLDGQVYSAPFLQSTISTNGIITGQFSQAEISYLIKVLAAGSLEGALSPEPIAQNTLGPTIGKDNLNRGLIACLISVIAVAIFMLIYYFFAGLVADFALLCNGLIIFGLMSVIDGTFTLPGLAGIVLTIGMAVDANVLIYERIREELFAGEEDLRGCIRLGYGKALSTIIDANVTNLIICLVLLKTATAEVKGFALTLTIGILATLFTALFVTRIVYTLYTELLKIRKLPMLPTVMPAIHRLLEPNVRWVSLRGAFWTVSLIAVMGSVAMVGYRGVDMFDTEFRGGVTATMVTARTGDSEGSRLWLPQIEVEQRIKAIGDQTEVTAPEGDPQRISQMAVRELRNAIVQTTGVTRQEDGQTVAQSFNIKVANPRGIGENESITDDIVRVIVEAFTGQIDIQPSRTFDGVNATTLADASSRVEAIDRDDIGTVIGDNTLRVREPLFRGGAAIMFDSISPPIAVAEMEQRIEHMRRQLEHQRTAGRRTKVIGRTLADGSSDLYTSLLVLVYEKNLSAEVVERDVWFRQLAGPEWMLMADGLRRQSSLQQVSGFSSSVAETLAANAAVAVILCLLGILGYIWVRFGSLWYSAAAIVALVHDVAIALGLLALTAFVGGSALGRALGIEAFRIDLGVVAAMLTIIGYSLNDTIVILDRIRENRGKRPMPTAAIVNRSINQTVSRTLLTSTTTIMAVLIMYAVGGTGIRPFTFCLLVGLFVGTYSSVAIAAPLVFRGQGPRGEAAESTAPAPSDGDADADVIPATT